MLNWKNKRMAVRRKAATKNPFNVPVRFKVELELPDVVEIKPMESKLKIKEVQAKEMFLESL